MVKFNISSISHSQSGWAEDKMFTGCLLAYIKRILMSSMLVGTQILNGEMSTLGWLYWQMNFHERGTKSLLCLSVTAQGDTPSLRTTKKGGIYLKTFEISNFFSKCEPLQQPFLVHTGGLERQSMPQQPLKIRGWYSISWLCKQTVYTNWSSC